ncbi:MAG: DUF2520 domain-containing protein [Flavobacteriales bacterium]|nr:DUF2520 domain-containing protein [Flavobacteriales bacterium]
MVKITIIGGGNVAHHLIEQVQLAEGLELVQAWARNTYELSMRFPELNVTSDFSLLEEADIYVLAVSDDAIASVSAQLPFTDRLVVHVSGTQPLTLLSDKNRRGVWYPLQSFSKEKKIDLKEVPFCLETENKEDLEVLKQLTVLLNAKVYELDSEQRKALHVAAVFCNNFVNQMYHLADSICEQHNLPFEILQPLILATAKKVKHSKPFEVQTGPAVRNDQNTINNQQDFLKDVPQTQKIYNLLTRSIQETHVKELQRDYE